MAKGGLTPKQEKFVQCLVKGMSKTAAYKKCYNAKNMKEETINSKACLLSKKDNVRARYEELMGKAESKAVMSAQERMEWLTEVLKDIQREPNKKVADLSTKMKALDILNKMSGEYKTILDGNVEVTKKLEDLL